ncbi:MAG: hypothetical protein FWE91_02060 [Defluviitaleaceae bacterium]|nr:hypothetical protein [Defluviitaleaceae bacterium]MCL2836093.1 hypothetical protein [Defluviitaleaceae bacterium]
MKKKILLTLAAAVLLLAFGAQSLSAAAWISPMLSISIDGENKASVFCGEALIEIAANDFGREKRGMIAAETPAEGVPLVLSEITAEELIAGGALKLTASFAYDGDEEYGIRFRFRVDRFQGHSVTQYGLGADAGVLILWQDADGIWRNIRRTGWGGEFTGGTDTPGWFYPAAHATLSGTPYPVFTFDINRENAADFASQDFYLVFIEEVPFRINDDGAAADHTSGYVITYQAELPDGDGHFHNFLVLASASVYVHVPEVIADDCDDVHDDCEH